MHIIAALTVLDDSRYVRPELKKPVSERKVSLLTPGDLEPSPLEREVAPLVDLDIVNIEEGELLEADSPDTSGSPSIRVDYSFHHDTLLAEQLHTGVSVDYAALWYGADTKEKGAFELKDEYWVTSVPTNDTETEMLSTDEAQATFVDIQYSTIIGAASDVNSTDRRKFDLWIKFNRAFFNLFESTYAVTREVDYKPLA